MNEYNLIIEARNKNEQAINLLLSKYYNNIKAIVFKYKTYINKKQPNPKYKDFIKHLQKKYYKFKDAYSAVPP